MCKKTIVALLIITILSSCEEVINVDLNSSEPVLVVEARIYKDSVGLVRLTKTNSYFSNEEPGIIEDAIIKISNGTSSEELTYTRDGYYFGNSVIGKEEYVYEIEIRYDGIAYKSISEMPLKTEINSIRVFKDETPGILNPEGKTVFTILCEFRDNPDREDFYMIRFINEGKILERYYLLTESGSNSGTVTNINNIISFSESIFFDGGEVRVELISLDEPVYTYFMQLSDILFWKRRVMPPTPYNPKSNISNGALGYFAAWAIDSEIILLE